MPPLPGPLRAFNSRPFAGYWAAQTISNIADRAFWVALTIKLVGEHRPGLLAAALAANTLALVAFMLLGGALADRFGAKRGVVAGDLVRGFATLLLVIGLGAGYTGAGLFIALAALLGGGEALFSPAYGVVVPQLVGDDALAAGNALRLAGEVAAATLGPLAALAAGKGGLTRSWWQNRSRSSPAPPLPGSWYRPPSPPSRRQPSRDSTTACGARP